MKLLIISLMLTFSSAAFAANSNLVCTVANATPGAKPVISASEVAPLKNGEASLSTTTPEPESRRYFASVKDGLVSINAWTTKSFKDAIVEVSGQGRASVNFVFSTYSTRITCVVE